MAGWDWEQSGGALGSDADHGDRGGGSLHADATTSASGFMSASDKTKLNAVTTANIPSSGEKAALAGTSGTAPSGSNKLVDAADTRLTNSRAPTGSAGGDLSGSYPGPTVSKVQGFDWYNGTPAANQIPVWSGSNNRWEPASRTTKRIQIWSGIGTSWTASVTTQQYGQGDGAGIGTTMCVVHIGETGEVLTRVRVLVGTSNTISVGATVKVGIWDKTANDFVAGGYVSITSATPTDSIQPVTLSAALTAGREYGTAIVGQAGATGAVRIRGIEWQITS